MDFYQFHLPTKIIFQEGIVSDFSAELSTLNLSRVLVVTDKMLEKLKVINPLLDGLKSAGVEVTEVFTDVPENSELKKVKECADAAARENADGIIAIGGGSVIDTAKAANILFTHGGDLVTDYSGSNTLTTRLKPFIAIPTTAGTGSEVTSVAVILDESTNTKLLFTDRYLYADLAVLDPAVTKSMPPKLTAATGMDSLVHAVESITSVQANPVSDAYAEKAIQLIKVHLLNAVEDGNNMDARGGMLTASTLAGIAFNHAMVGVIHGMSHATGGLCHVHHGTANSIFLPWGIEYNMDAARKRYEVVAKAMGVGVGKLISEIQNMQKDLNKACGLPFRLRDTGLVKESDLETIAEGTVNDGTSFYNPREVVKEEVLEQIKKAW